MFENRDTLGVPRPDPAIRTLHVVPHPAPSALVSPHNVRRAAPRTAEEWTALAKVGSGELDIPAAHCDHLVALGLIVTVSGRPVLTRRGRYTLGLAE